MRPARGTESCAVLVVLYFKSRKQTLHSIPLRVSMTLYERAFYIKLIIVNSTCTVLCCWYHGFEFCWRHEISPLVFVACRAGSGLWDGLNTHLEDSYRLFVCVCVCVCLTVCDLETSTMWRPRARFGLLPRRNEKGYTYRWDHTLI
jgi:hypothetical protein